MTECRCETDGGVYCYKVARAEAEASGEAVKIAAVDLLYRTRVAKGLTFHLCDPVTIQRIARIFADALSRPKPTPEQVQRNRLREAEEKAKNALRALEKERQRQPVREES